MTRISPKIMNVEGNRIEYIDETDYIKCLNRHNSFHNVESFSTYYGKTRSYFNDVGRFPTQLYTNIKNEQFKYVKNI
jgi:hypothetical protein